MTRTRMTSIQMCLYLQGLNPVGQKPGSATVRAWIAQGLPWHSDTFYPVPRRFFYLDEIDEFFKGRTTNVNDGGSK